MAQTRFRHHLTLAARILAGIITATFVILFIVSLWLLGPSGQSLVRDLVAGDVSRAVGYQLEAKDVELDLPIALAIGELTVADEDGIWLTAEGVTISVLPTFKILNDVILPDAKARVITVLRQPKPPRLRENEGSGSALDLSIPDLRIGDLTLEKDATGLENALSTSIVGSLALSSNDATLEFSMVAEVSQGLPALNAARIDVTGLYQIEDNLLFFDSANLGSDLIDAAASGRLNTQTQRIDASLKASSETLSSLTPGLDGTLDAEVKVTGALTAPTLDGVFTTSDVIYQNRAIPDSRLSIGATPEDRIWSGKIEFEAGELATARSPFAWRGNTLSFSNFSIADKFGQISGTVDVNTNTFLATGSVQVDLPQMEIYQELSPITIGGGLTGSAALSPSAGKQTAQVKAQVVNLAVADIQLQSGEMKATFSDIVSALPDTLMLSVSDARLGDTMITNGMVNADRKNELWQVRSQARGTAGQPFDIEATGSGEFTTVAIWQATIVSLNGTVGDKPVSIGAPVALESAAESQSLRVGQLKFGKGQYALEGQQQTGQIQGTFSGKNVSLSDLGFGPAPEWADALGTIKGTFGGTPSSIAADATFDLQGLRLTGDRADGRAQVIASLRDGQARTKINITDGAAIRSQVEASIPATLSLEPFAFEVAGNAPLQGTMDLSLDVTALSKLALPLDQSLTGKVDGSLALGGTLAQPSVRGQLNFRDGSYAYMPVGLELKALAFDLEADGERIAIRNFRATDPAGNPLKAEGVVTLASIDRFAYNMSIEGEQLELLNHPNAIGSLSVNLSAEGDQTLGQLSGTLTSQTLAIQLPDQFVETVPELNVVETIGKTGSIQKAGQDPNAYQLELDMVLKADNKVFVRGWGLDAELKGNLAIKGKASAPQVTGKLNTIRGRYEEFGKQLTLTKADIVFEGDMPPSPFLDIVGTTSAAETTISLNITGPLQDPSLGIASSPTLPEDEALSLLLFGSGVANISAVQAVQLANSLRRFSGVGPTGPTALGRIRNTIGVDSLTLKNNGDTTSGTALGVGKYIGDNIYLEIEQGLEAGSGKAKVEVDVTPSISVESGTSVSGDQNIGINWKRDY